jgi:hypothetical protein
MQGVQMYKYNHSGKIDTTIHPGTLTATNTVSSVTLDWGASTDNLITYEVFRNDVFYVETSNLSYFDNTGDMIEKLKIKRVTIVVIILVMLYLKVVLVV